MGKENWEKFIRKTSTKSKAHLKAAEHWNRVEKTMQIIIVTLTAITTFLTLIHSLNKLIISGVAALAALVSSIEAFLSPSHQWHEHLQQSREFQLLMLRMARCKTLHVYEELWEELNKSIFDAPLLTERFMKSVKVEKIEWTIRLQLLEEMEQRDRKLTEGCINHQVVGKGFSSNQGTDKTDKNDMDGSFIPGNIYYHHRAYEK